MILQRLINLPSLLDKKSHFLFGPRATGKSTLINSQLTPRENTLYINLLRNEFYLRLTQEPEQLESIIDAHEEIDIVVIDEVQRVPLLLNEVHRLIEERSLTFLLTGSSARSLRKKGVNLLAGRARKVELYPLVSNEIPSFDLNKYLLRGGLPAVYLSDEPREELAAYVDIYLKEEVQAESLVRNNPGFTRFLQTASLTSGKMLNFTSVASDIGLPVSTVREYYHILEDTFLGFMLPAYTKTIKRKAVSTAKFYLFDLGVMHYLNKVGELPEGSEVFGQALEHFIALELRAYLSYRRYSQELTYWRSKSGFEVDFLVGDELAIEVKSTRRVQDKHLKGINALQEEGLIDSHLVISLDPISRKLNDKTLLVSIHDFLTQLWSDQLIKAPSW